MKCTDDQLINRLVKLEQKMKDTVCPECCSKPDQLVKVHDHGYVRYVDHMGSDMRIVEFARISYGSPSKGPEADQKLLNYLWRNRHTSPFEMCKVTFNIKMPIFVMRQFVRHRMQNLNEVSARYTQLPAEFYIPEKWRANLEVGQNKQHSVVIDRFGSDGDGGTVTHESLSKHLMVISDFCYKEYQKLLDCGVARELARMVLPLNIYTEIYTTWDLKNLLHFLSLRLDEHAQSEIRDYAKVMSGICDKLFPWTMAAFRRYKVVVQDLEL